MPEKEGAEEKTTKSVVNKKQKQMMGEEGYDIARDEGRVKPSKDKKDATSYPVSDEMKKTKKENEGPSALEIVKKKYKGQIMDVKKEELDLTQVAEAFNGNIVEMERIGPEYKERIANMKKGYGLESGTVNYSTNKPKVKVTKNLTGSSPNITGNTIKKKTRNLFPKAGSANTPAVKKVKKDIAKRLATQTKTAQKKIIKTVGKKAATKGIAKVGGKFIAKRIPGLGAIISGAEAIGKLATGDFVGAGLAAGEGILSSLPGLGTVASTALGGYSAVRDARRAVKATNTVRKVLKSTKGAKGAVAVKKAFRKSPRTITKKLSPTKKTGFKGFMSKVKDPKTATGKIARAAGGIGLDIATPGGITKRLLGSVKPSAPQGGMVGRRSAGGFTAA